MAISIRYVLPSRAGPEDMGERQPLPLYPLDSLTPFVARAAALDPGLVYADIQYFRLRGDLDRRAREVRFCFLRPALSSRPFDYIRPFLIFMFACT